MAFFSNNKKPEIIDDNTIPVRTMDTDLNQGGAINNQQGFLLQHTPDEQVSIPNQELDSDNPFFQAQQENPITEEAVRPEQQPQERAFQPAPTPQTQPMQFTKPLHTEESNETIPSKNETYVKQEGIIPKNHMKIIITSIILIVMVIFGGVYYFILTRKNVEEQPSLTENGLGDTIQETQEKLKETTSFATDKPNYLPIDTTSTKEAVQSTLLQEATKVKEQSQGQPLLIEFFVTDKDNNPLSFKTFASLSGISLPDQIIDSMGDTFSLFIHSDGTITRSGLSISTKDNAATTTLLNQEESRLQEDLKPLFLGDSALNATKNFANSSYKNFAIRFMNIDLLHHLSIDYTVTSNHLIIGTSKESVRSILDTFQQ